MYENYFGLREPPFNVTPDPRFFFANSCYNEAFATLRYGIAERKGFIVMTGEPGTGKTTLLKRLLSTLDRNVHTAWVFDPHLAFQELFRLTLADLGLRAEAGASRLSMLGQFYDYLVKQLGEDHIVALLIDEAQDLNDTILEELRLLSNLEASGVKLLQIVLIGQPELDARLDHVSLRQLKQRIALRSRIVPLASHEVGPYIEFRLTAAGYAGKPVFVDDTIEQIARYSKGTPRIINVICDNALLLAYAQSRKSVSADMIAETVADLRLGDLGADELPPVARLSDDEHEYRWFQGASFDYAQDKLREASRLISHLARRDSSAPPRNDDSDTVSAPRPVLNREPSGLKNRGTVDRPAAVHRAADPAAPASLTSTDWANRTESRWLGLTAAVATLVGVLALVEIFSYRAQFDYLAAVSEPLEKIKAAVGPIPEQIRDVLMTRARSDDALRMASAESPSEIDAKRASAVRSFPPRKPQAAGGLERNTKIGGTAAEKTVPAPLPPGRTQALWGDDSEARRVPVPEKSRFEVVGNSFVRDEPSAESEIIATLRPGTKIRLIGKRGEYFRIRVSNGDPIRGYVHQEDAFFEPLD